MKQFLKILPKNKKGAEVLEMATKVFGALLVLGVLGFVFIIIFGNLTDTADDALPTQSSNVVNESVVTVDSDGEALSISDYYQAVCTINKVINATSNDGINTGNYTTGDDGCIVYYKTTIGDPDGFNNSNWNVSYSYTYKDSAAQDVTQNLTAGAASFFANAGTWLTLLSVVIIISIVALVIAKVKGSKEIGGSGESGGFGSSGSSDEGLL